MTPGVRTRLEAVVYYRLLLAGRVLDTCQVTGMDVTSACNMHTPRVSWTEIHDLTEHKAELIF